MAAASSRHRPTFRSSTGTLAILGVYAIARTSETPRPKSQRECREGAGEDRQQREEPATRRAVCVPRQSEGGGRLSVNRRRCLPRRTGEHTITTALGGGALQ